MSRFLNFVRRRALSRAIRTLQAICQPLLLERGQLDVIDDPLHPDLIALDRRIEFIETTITSLWAIRDAEAT